MKKLILVIMLGLFCSTAVFSQGKDQISLVKKKYYLNDKKLSGKELHSILKNETASAPTYKKFSQNMLIGTALVGVGTVTLLVAALNPPAEEEGPLPGLVSDEEMNKHLVPVLIGGGVALVGIPFLLTGSKQLKKSVTLYNSKNTVGSISPKLNLVFASDKVSLCYRF